ncbi:STM4015 family protein [Polymorphospora rubra]|uniref:STM4015 family protein n=1 Tax=Polymorphospora rubra TaxID=338584 RepID=UPI0033FACCAE
MAIYQHITEFAGLPVTVFDPESAASVADPAATAWRIEGDYETSTDEFRELFEKFLSVVDPAQVRALIIGQWGEAYEESAPVDMLVEFAPRFSALRALFLAELTMEESEISWIQQGDITPLFTAFPELEILRVRGTEGLELTPLRHTNLREFAIESGGLPGRVVRQVAECDLPALTHLELWLGTDNYGGDATVDDFAPILAGGRLPALRRLGLRNAEIADQVAAAVAGAPVVARLDVLDMSLGMLGDDGVAALLAGQPLTHLKRLDLHRHYISDEVGARLTGELPGVEVDLSDQQKDRPGDRYVAVSE